MDFVIHACAYMIIDLPSQNDKTKDVTIYMLPKAHFFTTDMLVKF